jgi:ribosome-associated protein
MKSKKSPVLTLVRTCCRALDDKKAAQLTVLDVSAQSSITDFLILATATSEPHLRALRNDLEKVLDDEKVHVVGVERAQESGWVVIDAFDVMIHLFRAEVRERFSLERLWRDANEISVSALLQAPKVKSPAKQPLTATKAKVKAKVKAKAKAKTPAKAKRSRA